VAILSFLLAVNNLFFIYIDLKFWGELGSFVISLLCLMVIAYFLSLIEYTISTKALSIQLKI